MFPCSPVNTIAKGRRQVSLGAPRRSPAPSSATANGLTALDRSSVAATAALSCARAATPSSLVEEGIRRASLA